MASSISEPSDIHTVKATDKTLDTIEAALDVAITRPGAYADELRAEAEAVLDIVKGWRA